MSDDLNERQLRFAEEYVKDLNATQAAIRAGYSEATAESQGSRLLSHVKVQAEIIRLKAQRSERTGIDAAWLLNRLADEAEADVADLYDGDGNLKPVQQWPAIWRKGLVGGLDVEQLFEDSGERRKTVGTIVKIKLSDRVKRLELIGKHIGVQAFREKVEIDVADPLKTLLQEISGRSVTPKEEEGRSQTAH
jgi:phage terminase small subunit